MNFWQLSPPPMLGGALLLVGSRLWCSKMLLPHRHAIEAPLVRCNQLQLLEPRFRPISRLLFGLQSGLEGRQMCRQA